jgi:aspartate aminotransferase
MFDHLATLAADPILGLMSLYRNEVNPNKVDLGVGVYKDDQGNTPVLRSVRLAEQDLIAHQLTKVYVGPAGNPEFNQSISRLLLGNSPCLTENRFAAAQTPGGCGALRVAAELIKIAYPSTTIWVSDPTWGNHIPLLGNAGIAIRTYPYYDKASSAILFEQMVAQLRQVPAGDLVLLHGCCHNPTGADLSPAQWHIIGDLALERGFIPFIDMAYQGFAEGLDEDAYGLRYLAAKLPELVVAVSCSKNFGLYRERVGFLGVMTSSSQAAAAVQSYILASVRGIYSMPPDHGANIVGKILSDQALNELWQQELAVMRTRISQLRALFCLQMRERLQNNRFDFVGDQKGMFSYLGLTEQQVLDLRRRDAIYLLSSSRASIAGLSLSNMHYVCDAIARLCDN